VFFYRGKKWCSDGGGNNAVRGEAFVPPKPQSCVTLIHAAIRCAPEKILQAAVCQSRDQWVHLGYGW